MGITFQNLKGLIKQARLDGACKEGLKYLRSQPDLESAVRNCERIHRRWALIRGYVQFEEGFDWADFPSWFYSDLLIHKPEYANRIDFQGWSPTLITNLLRVRPEFIDRFDLSQLSSDDWSYIISDQPQLIQKCESIDFNSWEITRILRSQPQLADKLDLSKINRAHWGGLIDRHPSILTEEAVEKLREGLLCLAK